MPQRLAYLAQGRLYLKVGDLAPRLIESAFAQGVLDRASQHRERNEWKGRARMSEMGGPSIWGNAASAAAMEADLRRIQMTGLTRAAGGQLLYALDTGGVGGLFTYDIASEHENRLFHKQEFVARDLAGHPGQEKIALSLPMKDASAHIATIQPGGSGLRRLTEGDVLDQAPSWAPGGTALVYQSAGIARNARGMAVATGPYAICKLDLEEGSLSTLLESNRFDYLVPKIAGDGALYCIRRPYQSTHYQFSPVRLLTDILLFPFRLLRAIFMFLNFFSMVFAHKPLTTAGGPPQKVDTRFMMLWGKVIDAEKLMAKSKEGKNTPLVPKTWELIRVSTTGETTVVATNVLSFDLAADGAVVFTDGSRIVGVSAEGERLEVCVHPMVQQVLVVD